MQLFAFTSFFFNILVSRVFFPSPRKAVHFSEIDQIKLMSQESLISTAPSDGSSNDAAQLVHTTHLTCSPKRNNLVGNGSENQNKRNSAHVITTTTTTTPTRNQSVQL